MLSGGILYFEAGRLFNRRNIIITTGILILAAFFCRDGIADYKRTLANKKPFQEIERDKISPPGHYPLYGPREVRRLFIPTAMSVYFNDLAVFQEITARVDTTEKLNKELFANPGGYMDFSGIMYMIGSFLGLLYGFDGTRNRDYSRMLSDLSGSRKMAPAVTLARVILLNLVFWLVSGLALLWVLIHGLQTANIFFLVYVPELTLLITFFIMTGAVLGTLKNKTTPLIALPLVYFLSIFFIPWLLQKAVYMEAKNSLQPLYDFENETLKPGLILEKQVNKNFEGRENKNKVPGDIDAMIELNMKSIDKKTQDLESQQVEKISKRVRTYQIISAFWPTTFYLSSSKELSSKGFLDFVDFYRFARKSFIKGNGNFFYGQSRLPAWFFGGLGLTGIYILALWFILYRRTAGKGRVMPVKTPQIDFNRGNTLFALCKDNRVKDEIFRYFQGQPRTVCIDKIPVNFQFEVGAGVVLDFLCRLAEAPKEKVLSYLKILGIEDLSTLKLEETEILKFYLAVKIAKNEPQYIVFKDFFAQESRELEEAVFKLLTLLEIPGLKILYLSCKMYSPKTSLDDDIKVETFCIFPLPFDKVTLRSAARTP